MASPHVDLRPRRSYAIVERQIDLARCRAAKRGFAIFTGRRHRFSSELVAAATAPAASAANAAAHSDADSDSLAAGKSDSAFDTPSCDLSSESTAECQRGFNIPNPVAKIARSDSPIRNLSVLPPVCQSARGDLEMPRNLSRCDWLFDSVRDCW